MAEMSLADAIREGSRYTQKAAHFYFRGPLLYEAKPQCRACSLGAAMYAVGIVDATYSDADTTVLPVLTRLREMYPELDREVLPPPDFPIHDYCNFISEGAPDTLFKMIEILTFEWDREKVADWVEEQVAKMQAEEMSAIADAELVPELA